MALPSEGPRWATLADTMGIVYTPQEIVDFMCASVAEVLDKEFGKKLWSDDVYIIDPCMPLGPRVLPGTTLTRGSRLVSGRFPAKIRLAAITFTAKGLEIL